MLSKKQMLINEIATRKAKKEAQQYLINNCMGKTVKDAKTILFGDGFIQLYDVYLKCSVLNYQQLSHEPCELKTELKDEYFDDLHDLFLYFFFNDVFKSVETGVNIWNCAKHNFDCDYILTEKDLKPSW